MLICPKCGSTSQQKDFIDSFCSGCYPFKVMLPKEIRLDKCVRCGKLRMKGEWKRTDLKKLNEYVAGKCKGDFERAEYDADQGTCRFIFLKNGKEYAIEKGFLIDVNKTICPDCSRSSGGYFEAIIQVRGEPDAVERKSRKLIEALEKKTFIPKIEDMHNGIDIYVGSTKAASQALQEFSLKPSGISKKLAGVSQGKKLYRTSFSVRV